MDRGGMSKSRPQLPLLDQADPMAHAPKPMRVMFRSELPSCLVLMGSSVLVLHNRNLAAILHAPQLYLGVNPSYSECSERSVGRPMRWRPNWKLNDRCGADVIDSRDALATEFLYDAELGGATHPAQG